MTRTLARPLDYQHHFDLAIDTKPLVPVHVEHRNAQQRVAASFGTQLGSATAVAHFEDCLQNLRRMGLTGPGLIVAAEHMTYARLRRLTSAARDVVTTSDHLNLEQ